MYHDFYLFGAHAEEPSGFHDLKALVHHRSGVDGDFRSHVPIGMVKRLLLGDGGQLLGRVSTERASGCREDDFLQAVARLQTLKHGGMLGIDGKNGHMAVGHQACYQVARHDERLLVGQCYGLSGTYGIHCRAQSGVAHHGSEHDVYGTGLHNLAKRVLAGIDFYGKVGQCFLQPVVFIGIGYHHGFGPEAARLLDELLHAVIGREGIGFVSVGVLGNDLQGLRADGACGTKYGYLFLHTVSIF